MPARNVGHYVNHTDDHDWQPFTDIPTDEIIFFRGVGIPPTSYNYMILTDYISPTSCVSMNHRKSHRVDEFARSLRPKTPFQVRKVFFWAPSWRVEPFKHVGLGQQKPMDSIWRFP
jgi:hypothetical protein